MCVVADGAVAHRAEHHGQLQLDLRGQLRVDLSVRLTLDLVRLFAEERQSGTWLLLRAQPIPLWKIVVGKYLAALLLTVLALIPCIVHYYIVYYMAEPMGNIDSGQFVGSMMGLVFLSSSFTGISLLCSTWSKSQIVSFITSTVSCFMSVSIASIVISVFIVDYLSKR